MDNSESRLTQCFAVLFPAMDDHAIHQATRSTVPGWDSIATVTLVSVVEEEFGIQIAVEDVEHLLSFNEFLDYLRNRVQIP